MISAQSTVNESMVENKLISVQPVAENIRKVLRKLHETNLCYPLCIDFILSDHLFAFSLAKFISICENLLGFC